MSASRRQKNLRDKNPPVRMTRVAENRGWVDALNRIIRSSGRSIHRDHAPGRDVGRKLRPEPSCVPEVASAAGVVAPSLSYPDGTPNTIRLQNPRVSVELRRLVNIASHIVLKRRVVARRGFVGSPGGRPGRDVDERDDDVSPRGAGADRARRAAALELLRQRLDMRPARRQGWTCHYAATSGALGTLLAGELSIAIRKTPPTSAVRCRSPTA